MEIEINYKLSAGKNAEDKYILRNKLKSKVEGLDKAYNKIKTSLEKTNKDIIDISSKIVFTKRVLKNKFWFSKFRWFFTTNNFLVIAGRDAKNNELLIKKYMDKNDVYFHADIFGAPHTILKTQIEDVPIIDKKEAACFAASFSSAWKSKIFSVDVYSVSSNQVSKTAQTGESLSTGSFVISGKREYFRKSEIGIYIVFDKKYGVMAIPLISKDFKKYDFYIKVVPGNIKKADISKQIRDILVSKKINASIDEIESILPPGDCNIV
ncbi:MAG: NFACT RNA binding domain-containing protein [Candidatus ainarchaeum sp.]|nr:NFACT RNA binding domain-containing protein [Candidatus ainarchaeum sp.]MDD3976249.1 NFACT RNA binding domain-containing protein [Candidatus ainarchaeum sp.]